VADGYEHQGWVQGWSEAGDVSHCFLLVERRHGAVGVELHAEASQS
jgi:hypothetical protein